MRTQNKRWRARVVTVTLAAFGIGVVLAPAAEAKTAKTTPGYDVSYPQCGQALPSSPAFGIVGVNNGVCTAATRV